MSCSYHNKKIYFPIEIYLKIANVVILKNNTKAKINSFPLTYYLKHRKRACYT